MDGLATRLVIPSYHTSHQRFEYLGFLQGLSSNFSSLPLAPPKIRLHKEDTGLGIYRDGDKYRRTDNA